MADDLDRVALPPDPAEAVRDNAYFVKSLDPEDAGGQDSFRDLLRKKKQPPKDAPPEAPAAETAPPAPEIHDGLILSKKAKQLLEKEHAELAAHPPGPPPAAPPPKPGDAAPPHIHVTA